jgi:hypothetical protein
MSRGRTHERTDTRRDIDLSVSRHARRGTAIPIEVCVSLPPTVGRAVLMIVFGCELGGAQSLRGSRSSVNRMYNGAVSNDLDFLKTSKSVYDAVKDGELVPIGMTGDLFLDHVKYPFVLPRTRTVLYSFAARYRASCGERLVVTSAARPRSEQPRNASKKSVHPTGMAVDFRRPAGTCLAFMRKGLLALEKQGVLEATEERHPVHFHIAVVQRGASTPRPGQKLRGN